MNLKITERQATLFGIIGLIMWSCTATATALVRSIPLYELLTLLFFICSVVAAIHTTKTKRWSQIITKKYFILALVLYFTQIFYILAFQHAPSTEAGMISYSWPLMLIIASPLIMREKLKIQHIAAGVFGFIIVILILLADNAEFTGFSSKYIFGYFCAFAAATIWSSFVIFSKRLSVSISEIFLLYSFIGLIFSSTLHYKFETIYIPSSSRDHYCFDHGFNNS